MVGNPTWMLQPRQQSSRKPYPPPVILFPDAPRCAHHQGVFESPKGSATPYCSPFLEPARDTVAARRTLGEGHCASMTSTLATAASCTT